MKFYDKNWYKRLPSSFSKYESSCSEYERGSTPLVLDYTQLAILFCTTTIPTLYSIPSDSTWPQPCKQEL